MGNKQNQIERRQQRQHRNTQRAQAVGVIFGRDQQERSARRVASGLGWGFAGTDERSGAFVLVLPEIR